MQAAWSSGSWSSRFSHLMAVGIEGCRQRIAVVHGFRGFSHYGNSSWFRVFYTWVRWIARTTSSRYKTKRDRRPFFFGAGGGGHVQTHHDSRCTPINSQQIGIQINHMAGHLYRTLLITCSQNCHHHPLSVEGAQNCQRG